jgi:hypothetical protein
MRMKAFATVALMGSCVLGAAQSQGTDSRLVELSSVLTAGAETTPEAKIQAIEEIAAMGTRSGLASGLLFDRASALRESQPKVREAAALALRSCCEPRNRAQALRVVRFASQAWEPDPRVRGNALRTLAAFEVSDAATAVLDATSEANESDPAVREIAKELVRKGLAASAN